MEQKLDEFMKEFYLIGIGGVGMSALAQALKNKGYSVCGSDAVASRQTQMLKEKGVDVKIGHRAENISFFNGTVVYSDAISTDNVEFKAAKDKGLPLSSRASMLNVFLSSFDKKIAVGGSHGKTTTTAMCAHILQAARSKFTALIGGADGQMGNYFRSGEEIVLTEACEYKKNLLKLKDLSVAVWLNCDADHMECYESLADLKNTFYSFAQTARVSVVNGEMEMEEFPDNALTFGVRKATCDYTAKDISKTEEGYAFTLCERQKPLCRIRLRTKGYFQIYNALAAAAVMRVLGMDKEAISQGLYQFSGVKRRFERVGHFQKAELISDYAHHPKELKETLALAHQQCKGRVFAVFQPHTYSRTKLLMSDFVDVLSDEENAILFPTYPAREAYDEEGSADTLCRQIKNSLYVESVRELKSYLSAAVRSGDCVLLLGAGDLAERFFRE